MIAGRRTFQPRLACLDLGELEPGDRRQVARHERQHARRDERDDPDAEGGEDRGVDAVGCERDHRSYFARSSSSRFDSVAARSGRRPAVAGRPRQRLHADGDRRAGAEQDRRAGSGRRRSRSRRRSGEASTSSPNSATSAVLTSSFVLHSSISRWMNARSRWAWGASVARPSEVPQTGHMTSSSRSPSEVSGQANAAGASASHSDQAGCQRASRQRVAQLFERVLGRLAVPAPADRASPQPGSRSASGPCRPRPRRTCPRRPRSAASARYQPETVQRTLISRISSKASTTNSVGCARPNGGFCVCWYRTPASTVSRPLTSTVSPAHSGIAVRDRRPAPRPASTGASIRVCWRNEPMRQFSLRSGVDILAHELVVHRAALCGGDPPVAVDHERLRVGDDAEVVLRRAVLVAQVRVGQAVLVDEVLRVARHVEHVHAEHGRVLLRDPLVPALEQRRLVAAGLAPRRPVVEDDDLPAPVRERALGAALERRQRDLAARRSPATDSIEASSEATP